jgi:hypothetical protein
LREIWSDDMGEHWGYGVLGRPDGIFYSVLHGSGISAVVLPGPPSQLRVYFTKAEEQSLAVAWMPIITDVHAGDWNCASHLRSVKDPW